jgi:tetratricopeptide (TPR) repeat protein
VALVAVVVTDLVASTEARVRLGDQVVDELRRGHDDALQAVTERRGGRVVKGLGDGLLVTFPGTSEAMAGAVAMQQAIDALGRRAAEQLTMRVGISVGEVTWEDGDCFGIPVVEAGRLCAAAGGGQILCSDLVRALGHGPAGPALHAAGDLQLKGLPEPVTAWEVDWSPTGVALPVPPLLRTQGRFPFVGRLHERSRLEAAWTAAVAGERQAVLLGGEPGVGKTRLAAEAARSAIDAGGVALAGRCDEEGGPPYQPFTDALTAFLDACPADQLPERLGRFGGELARLVPEISTRVPGLTEPGQADEDTQRRWLFDALAAWVQAAGGGQPVLVVIDDLHWADRATLLALRHLLRSEELRTVLVIGTYRDTDLDRSHPLAAMRADLRRERSVERIDLKGLTAEEVRAFLEGAGGHELDAGADALVEALHHETEGNPFFLEETLAHLVETGAIHRGADGRWTSPHTRIEDFGIPEGVREVIGRRLSRLSEDCNRVLGMAAVLGAQFDIAVLGALAGSDVVGALEQAEVAGLITEIDATPPGYGFTHALIRQTLLEELSLARRQTYHLQAARVLQARGATAALLAGQLRQAGAAADLGETVDALLAAADEARRRLAWEEASDHWQAALELLDVRGAEPADQARLLERLGDAMFATGTDWEQGIEQLERAVAIHEGSGDRYRGAKLRSRIARNLAVISPERLDPRRAMAHAEAARPALEEVGDSPALAYLETSFATACVYPLRMREGLAAARRSLEIGRRLGHAVVTANAELMVGFHLALSGRVTEGVSRLEAAHLEAMELGAPLTSWVADWGLSAVAVCLNDPALMEASQRRQLESGALDGAPLLRRSTQAQLAGSLVEQGRSAEAQEIWDDLGHAGRSPPTRQLLADGSWEEAARTVQATAAHQLRLDDRWMGGWNLRWLARLSWLLGDPVAAASHLDDALRANDQGDAVLPYLYLLPDRVRVAWELGDQEGARAHLRRLEAIVPEIDELRGAEAHVLLARAVATDDGPAPEGTFAHAAEVARRYGAVWVEAEVLELWGRATGRVEPLAAALDLYHRIGAADRWLDRAGRLRAEVAGRAP